MTKSPPSPSSSPSTSPHVITCCNNKNRIVPIEIISEEEMVFLEAAVASSVSSPPRASSVFFEGATRSIRSITVLAKRRLAGEIDGVGSDMEDMGGTHKRNRIKGQGSLYTRFRRRTGLFVTDITSTEWCEKQMEFDLQFGRRTNDAVKAGTTRHVKLEEEEWCEKKMEFVLQFGRRTNDAMKAGTARHVKLEEEVVKKVKVSVASLEDVWAVKFMNFIIGVNQLLVEGLTRELPLIGFAEGIWIVGIVDEIRMQGETGSVPMLVDTKTRVRDTLPSDPQRRNGRLQLMCYKSLWDKAVADQFPSRQFFDYFSLNPYNILSEEIRQNSAQASIPAKTLDDIMMYYRNTCSMLVPADDQMLLRYESQKDCSLLSEDQFCYDPDWLKRQLHDCVEFWIGERQPNYVPEEERWKCRYCQFKSACPAPADVADSSSSPVIDTPHQT